MNHLVYLNKLTRLENKGPTAEDIAVHIIDYALGKDKIIISDTARTKKNTITTKAKNPVSFATGVVEGLKKTRQTKPVIVLASDTVTYDSALSELSAAAHRNTPLIYVCMNSESNTINHYNAATPMFTNNRSHLYEFEQKTKDINEIMSKHDVYVATASIGFPLDFIHKLQKAKRQGNFAFINLLCPDANTWGFEKNKLIDVSRLAVECGYWPLYEIDDRGSLTLNYDEKSLKDIQEFVNAQERFSKMNTRQLHLFEDNVNNNYKKILEMQSR